MVVAMCVCTFSYPQYPYGQGEQQGYILRRGRPQGDGSFGQRTYGQRYQQHGQRGYGQKLYGQ